MSALLSLNPIPLISWKGSTFNQIYSSIQQNGKNMYITDTQTRSYFSANPPKSSGLTFKLRNGKPFTNLRFHCEINRCIMFYHRVKKPIAWHL